MNQDGSDQRSIFFSPELFCSAWSQEGSKIIFGALQPIPGSSQEYVDLFTINPDGTNLNRITTGADAETYPSISPDGQRIVYMVNHRIFVMNIDGSGSHRLDARGSTDEDPAWSPEFTNLE
ncbi:PD40 domain-containing protein [candidate division KSB1 bacterium]|nr:PD40 domain-containing protein [candidate division KSB1 bacterium]